MHKDINEANVTKNEYRYCVVIHIMTMILCVILTIYFSFLLFLSPKGVSYETISILFIIAVPIIVAKWSFTEFVSTLRFYGSNIKIVSDSLIIYTDRKCCEIPLNKNVNVMFCMLGWLITWHSEKNRNVLLIRNSLWGLRYLKLEPFFKQKTNFLISSKNKKEILKYFRINRFRPLKYIKWPTETKSCNENIN